MSNIHFDTVGIEEYTDPKGRETFFQFMVPYRFLFQANDPDRLLLPARIMTVLLGLLLGLLIFFWGRDFYGTWAGIGALGLYCLEPNLFANASLCTTDFGVACFFTGTIYFLWRLTKRFTGQNLAGLCVFFALAQISKFSALLLGPIVLLLLAIRVFRSSPWPTNWGQVPTLTTLRTKGLTVFILVLLLAAVSFGAVWSIYAFRYSPASSADGVSIAEPATPLPNSKAVALARWVDRHHLLPQTYVRGFLGNQTILQKRVSFCNGQYSLEGWWYFFPFCVLVKSTLTLLLLTILSLGLCFRSPRTVLQDEIFLLLPVAFYLGFVMTTTYNIGIRHILPLYPFLILLAAKPFVASMVWCRRLACALLMLAGIELATVYPHPLAFFNQLAGGPRHGYRRLVDSNLDWGQDLKGLERWLKKHVADAGSVYLSYFGTASPERYHVKARYLPGYYNFGQKLELFSLTGGTYCISATMLQQVYSPFMGHWAARYEQLYQQALANLRLLEQSQNTPAIHQQLIDLHGVAYWNQQYEAFFNLRFARLCAYLRQRTPDDEIGYSILIYQLTDQQVQQALFGPPAELTPTIQIKGYPQ